MKQRRFKIITCTLILILVCASLQGCNAKKETAEPPDPNASTIELYETKLEHYESLVVSLREELLNEKEENFIAVCEYKLKIEELEDSIKTLSDKIGSISVSQEQSKDDSKYEQQYKNEGNKGSAVEVLVKSDFSYKIESGCVTITAYKGSSSNVIIPSTINGYPVTTIGEGAFQGSRISTVKLPDSVHTVDWFAFSDCAALSQITVPASVKSVGYGAFDRCSPSLTVICEKGSYIEAYAASWGMKIKTN